MSYGLELRLNTIFYNNGSQTIVSRLDLATAICSLLSTAVFLLEWQDRVAATEALCGQQILKSFVIYAFMEKFANFWQRI